MDPPLWSQLVQAFLGGLFTILTPCIYPLIPITLALFGVTAELPFLKRFSLALSYVGGICLTYTILGMVSAKTGALFGSALTNVWIITLIVVFLLTVALYCLDLIELPFIVQLQTSASKVGGKGYSGAFLMGTMSGFVAAPCAGPILTVFLALAAKSQDIWRGALLLAVYSFGFGSIFLLLGTFSHLIKRLPKAGTWMNAIKFMTAAALIAIIIYLTRPFFPRFFDLIASAHSWPILVVILIFTAMIGRYSYRQENHFLRVCAVILFALAGFDLAGLNVKPHPSVWITDYDQALIQAKTEKKIVLLDLFAEWCAACKEFDSITFPDSSVKSKLSQFVTTRLDLTTIEESEQAIMDKYQVIGLPCLLFLNADGKEIVDSRITGFMNVEEFLGQLNKVQKTKTAPISP